MSSLRIFSTGGMVVLWLMLVSAAPAASDRPNIILFVADDLGYGDVGCYGNAKNRTPHLDALAAKGMRFTDFHANGSMCTPTRAALLTGQYQNRFGRIFEGPLSYTSVQCGVAPGSWLSTATTIRCSSTWRATSVSDMISRIRNPRWSGASALP